MLERNNLITVDNLRAVIFSVLGYDDFNLIRSNKVYDRILFDYGYYGEGVTIKRIRGCLYYFNHICGLGNNQFQEGNNYKYRLKNEEIEQIIKLLKLYQKDSILNIIKQIE